MTGNSKDVSLYFHIPFCTKKCPYCHFFVLPDKEKFKAPFLNALFKEWELRSPALAGKRIVSIYFGGGTPTKLPPSEYARLLGMIQRSSVEIAQECEITLEANPEDVTLPLMQEFHSVGINRVSLGIQSLVDPELTLLGRTHRSSKSLSAIHAVHQAGISNISIDLLFELPAQTLSSFEKSLSAVQDLPITHLSLYNLTFEPYTIFFKKKEELSKRISPDREKLEMLNLAIETLSSFGLHRYEISAFCRSGKESLHNSGYWTARPFLGFGPSAFSYWEGSRFSNTTRFSDYLDKLKVGLFPVGFQETLSYPANLKELFTVQLRLLKGVNLPEFISRQGPLPVLFREKLNQLISQGWLKEEGEQIRLTEEGLLFYDSVAAELI